MRYNIDNAKKVLSALIAANAPAVAIPFLMAQVAHETGDFDSNVFRKNNNASGIMFINKPQRQKNATQGLPYPKKEQTGNKKYYYANFATLTDWARDYLRIVGKSVLEAKNIEDYAKKLKDKGYYTAALESYKAALVKHLNALKNTGLLKIEKTNNVAGILPWLIVGGLAVYFITK